MDATWFRREDRPLIIAHRGGSLEAPENTVEALEHAVACGSDWQEIDVGLTRDNHPVVLHDETLERTTSGTGRAVLYELAALEALTAHQPQPAADTAKLLAEAGIVAPKTFAPSFAQARVPSLRRALQVKGCRLMIELKVCDDPTALVRAVVADVRAARMESRVALGSFSMAAVAAARALAPELPRIGISEEPGDAPALLREQVDTLAVRSDQVEAFRARIPAHVPLWTWTIYSAAQGRRARQQGADGLITDAPRQLMAAAGGQT